MKTKMMRMLMALLLALPLTSTLSLTPSAAQESASRLGASCFCKVTFQSFGDTQPSSIQGSNLLLDLGVVATYSINNENNRQQCRNKCSSVAATNSNFNNPQYWLPKIQCNVKIAAYSAVGTSTYSRAQTPTHANLLDGLKCCTSPARIVCAPGASADTNGPGNKDCKRVWCTGPMSPQPPNNTLLGTWGFTWGNQVINWENPTSFTPAATHVFGHPDCS